MALGLVRWAPDRGVWVGALAGTLSCVLRQDTLLSRCLSPPRCINGHQRSNAGGYLAKDLHPIQERRGVGGRNILSHLNMARLA